MPTHMDPIRYSLNDPYLILISKYHLRISQSAFRSLRIQCKYTEKYVLRRLRLHLHEASSTLVLSGHCNRAPGPQRNRAWLLRLVFQLENSCPTSGIIWMRDLMAQESCHFKPVWYNVTDNGSKTNNRERQSKLEAGRTFLGALWSFFFPSKPLLHT